MLNENSQQIYEDIKKEPDLWSLFTNMGEYNPTKVDKHGRISYKFTSNKDVLKPRVSEYLTNKGYKIDYQDNKKFAIFLSHDVDDIFISEKQIIRSLVPLPVNRDMTGLKKFLISHLRKQNPYINFKKIIQLEKKYDVCSTFYFFATEKDILGNKYKIENLYEEIKYILDMDCEIGLHTGYYSYDKLDMIKTERKKLEEIIGKQIIGIRNHLLRFKIPFSWELLSKAGFKYDSSLGYHDMIGFRNGMCHPFRPFNLNNNKSIDIIEIPLCIGDIALFSYMKKTADESWEYIKKIIDNVEKCGGVLGILWHNWFFSFPVSYCGIFGKEWTSLYEKILNYCSLKKAWITTGEQIYDYVKKNNIIKKDTYI